jgi:DNA-binding IclR family transcriptional regulator
MGNPSVERTIQILEFLTTHPGRGFTLSAISRELHISVSTAASILNTLAERALLVRDPDNLEYRLGVALVPIGAAAERNSGALTLARREAQRLAEQFDCECIVTTSTVDETLFLARAGTGGPYSVSMVDGQRVPVAPPLGSPLIAWMDDLEAEAWLNRFRGELTEAERAHYHATVDFSRQRGYTVYLRSERENEVLRLYAAGNLRTPDGREQLSAALTALAHEDDFLPASDEIRPDAELSSIAAPIFEPNGTALLMITIRPTEAYRGRDVPVLARAVVQAAQRVTAAIDGRPRMSR